MGPPLTTFNRRLVQMRYIFLLLALLLPGVLFASECNTSCTFRRGDANCDGYVNGTDVYVIQQQTWTNWDAADANDNGVVNGSDATGLSYWLYYPGSYPPPPCPGPSNQGIDSTGDSLESCCSPPTFKLSPTTNGGCSVTLANDFEGEEWDNSSYTTGDVGDHCYGYGMVENYGGQGIGEGCEQEESIASFDVRADVTDSAMWTKRRLENVVQGAQLYIDIEATMTRGSRCLDTPCNYTDELLVKVISNDFIVYIETKTSTGGTGPTIVIDDWSNHELLYRYWTYLSNGQCTGFGELKNDPMQMTLYADISNQLIAAAGSNCQLYQITKIEVLNLILKFNQVDVAGVDRDIAETEKIQVEVTPYIEYTWDTCSQ